ncbi:proline racemase family protein [Domibacillus sp. 8LH]|uniref:proline racemase family protein n=1 Tax=Domibacillus sp. 8LH TaxID=3073900 RepID=UPI00317C654E
MINFSKFIETIDTHTMGQPTRIIVSGVPKITGDTMLDKKNSLKKEMPWLRELLMNEPRGHQDMFGAILCEPSDEDCDAGLIFMDNGGYLNMCGHGTIGTITAGIQFGLLPRKEMFFLDTPSGKIECTVKYKDQKVNQVSFRNVPSFVLEKNVSILIEGYGTVQLDIAFGGSIFAIVDASQFDLKLTTSETLLLSNLGMKIKQILNEQFHFEHPQNPDICTVDLVEFSLKKGGNQYRNVVVFGNGQIDRSPCGTGTSAKLATLDLQVGESIIQESIIDSCFIGKVVEKTTVAGFDAIIPEITGSAWVTGLHRFALEETDPYQQGFTLNQQPLLENA